MKGATAQMRSYIHIACCMTGVCSKFIMGHVRWGGRDADGNPRMIGRGCDGNHHAAHREHLSAEDVETFLRNVVWRETQVCFNMDAGCTDTACTFAHSFNDCDTACRYRGMGLEPSLDKYFAPKKATETKIVDDEDEPEVDFDGVGTPPQQHLSILEIDDITPPKREAVICVDSVLSCETQEWDKCRKYLLDDALFFNLCGKTSPIKTVEQKNLCEVLVDDGTVPKPCICNWMECSPYTLISGEIVCICCNGKNCKVCPPRMKKFGEQKAARLAAE